MPIERYPREGATALFFFSRGPEFSVVIPALIDLQFTCSTLCKVRHVGLFRFRGRRMPTAQLLARDWARMYFEPREEPSSALADFLAPTRGLYPQFSETLLKELYFNPTKAKREVAILLEQAF